MLKTPNRSPSSSARSLPAFALAACLLTLTAGGCAYDKQLTAQSRSLPPTSTIVPCEQAPTKPGVTCEPQPDVRRDQDMTTIANRYKQAFDRANCRLELAYRNVDTISAGLRGDKPAGGWRFVKGKQAQSECEVLRAMAIIEAKTKAKTGGI